MKYAITILNKGKDPVLVRIALPNGSKRPALFSTITDAIEASFIVAELRNDTAYEGCHIAPLKDLEALV